MADGIKEQRRQLALVVAGDAGLVAEMVERLSGPSRRNRQNAAAVLALVAASDAQLMAGHAGAIVDALNRPEAQTRWECLDILTGLAPIAPEACEAAIPEAESALFDEGSGPLRLAAMRFFCRIGSLSPEHSRTAWPLVNEAIQCYHGDPEFQDMLIAVASFAEGSLADEVKAELKERMAFDASNAKGILKKRAQRIIDILA